MSLAMEQNSRFPQPPTVCQISEATACRDGSADPLFQEIDFITRSTR